MAARVAVATWKTTTSRSEPCPGHPDRYGRLLSTLTVTDTQTGKRQVYKNPSGKMASFGDTGTF